MQPSEDDGVRVDQVTEQRVVTALDSLLRAMSGLGADMAVAASLFLQRGDPYAEPPTIASVLVDQQIQLWFLANQLGVDIRAEIGRRLDGYRERATELIQAHPEPAPAAPRSNLGDRCMFLLGAGGSLRREPVVPPVWVYQKAAFPDAVVQTLIKDGCATTKEDGASGLYVVVTKRGAEIFREMMAKAAEADREAAMAKDSEPSDLGLEPGA